MITDSIRKRFWERVDKHGSVPLLYPELGRCWVWTAYKNPAGYGRIAGQRKYSAKLVHRVSYEIHFGSIPEDLCVLHKCDNRSCVNPAHLWLGTNADNNRDRHKKGRDGTGLGGAKLTVEDVRLLRELRERFGATNKTNKELAVRFGIHELHVGRIANRKLWKNVP